jgi:hypothetical protein
MIQQIEKLSVSKWVWNNLTFPVIYNCLIIISPQLSLRLFQFDSAKPRRFPSVVTLDQ